MLVLGGVKAELNFLMCVSVDRFFVPVLLYHSVSCKLVSPSDPILPRESPAFPYENRALT